MSQMRSTKVPFATVNVSKCMCPKCPVQTKSSCVSGKMSKIGDALKKTPLKPEDIPGVYCSTGKATCQDIGTMQPCICGSCAVYSGYKLTTGKPQYYFCKAGAAK